jgi:hypothetical protein
VAFYRVYRLRGPKNEVEFFHEFEAEDDESAIAAAERWRSLDAMELWSNHQKIHRWEAVSPAGREERVRESVQDRAAADQPRRS